MAAQSRAGKSHRAGNELVNRHPLQRLPAPSRTLSMFIHVLGLLSFAYAFNYLIVNPSPINDSYGWHMQYLTIIGLSLATATFGAGLLADLFLSPTFFGVKNGLSVASAPLEFVIAALYWGLRAIDTRLVYPDWAPRLALFDDFSFHVFPPLLLAFDLLFLSPPTTVKALPALALAAVFCVGYWFWVEACFAHNGFYPYPIFAELDAVPRMGLFAGSGFVFWGAWLVLRGMYGWVNGNQLQQSALKNGGKKQR